MLRPCRHAMCISISCMLHVIDVCTAEEAFAHDLSLAMFILVIIDIKPIGVRLDILFL